MFELGNNLREARQRRRIDLVIAEQDTKIRSKYLAALETEDFDVLPGPVFVRGFLRTYSRYLGLDPQLFIDEYNARFGRFEEVDDHTHPALGRPGLAQERARRGRRTTRALVIVTLVALAVFAWLGLRDQDTAQSTAPKHHTASVTTTPSPATVDQGALTTAAQHAAGTSPRATDTRSSARTDGRTAGGRSASRTKTATSDATR